MTLFTSEIYRKSCPKHEKRYQAIVDNGGNWINY